MGERPSRSRAPVLDQPRKTKRGWAVRYRWYDGDGQRQSGVAHGGSATEAKRQAQAEAERRLQEADAYRRGERRRHEAPTVAEYARAIEGEIATRQRPRQVARTRQIMERWWLPAIGDRRLDLVTAREIKAVIAKARDGLAPATCNRILAVIGLLFRLAFRDELVDVNPVARTGRLREGRVLPDVLTARELIALLWALPPRWRLLVALCGLAGLRISEARKLQAGDVHLEDGYVVVRGGDEGTKSGHQRLVPITSSVLALELREALSRRRGPVVTHRYPRKAIAAAVEQAGLTRMPRPHLLRAGFASLTHAAGAPARVVQAWLGHSSIVVTERYLRLAKPSAEGRLLFDQLEEAIRLI